MHRAIFVLVVVAILGGGEQARAADFDHRLFDEVLKAHVRSALVDYPALKTDERLPRYLAQLAAADPTTLTTRNEQLAFWINAYNAYTLKLVADHYPVAGIREIKLPGAATPWAAPIAIVGGKPLTLDYIEHEILRKQLHEPRIHFAIVCAALSCPQLRGEAYVADRLDEQLENQGRWFFSWRNQFDVGSKSAGISMILKWFAEDFGGNKEAILRFVAPYTIESVRRSIESAPTLWKVTYLKYDWSLNAQPHN